MFDPGAISRRKALVHVFCGVPDCKSLCFSELPQDVAAPSNVGLRACLAALPENNRPSLKELSSLLPPAGVLSLSFPDLTKGSTRKPQTLLAFLGTYSDSASGSKGPRRTENATS